VLRVTCPEAQFQADFFNNVAAVAMVLLFAKVFTHRSRKKKPEFEQPTPWRANLRAWNHALAVLGAATAAAAALWATEDGSDNCLFHWFAWGGLLVAVAALVGEILVDDVRPHWKDLRKHLKGTQNHADTPPTGHTA
jgi:hypothetical protein